MHLDGALLRFTGVVSIFYANIFHFLLCVNFRGSDILVRMSSVYAFMVKRVFKCDGTSLPKYFV